MLVYLWKHLFTLKMLELVEHRYELFFFFSITVLTPAVSFSPSLPMMESQAVTAGQPHLQFQMKLWSSKFLHLPGQTDPQLPQLNRGKGSLLCASSSGPLLFCSSCPPSTPEMLLNSLGLGKWKWFMKGMDWFCSTFTLKCLLWGRCQRFRCQWRLQYGIVCKMVLL